MKVSLKNEWWSRAARLFSGEVGLYFRLAFSVMNRQYGCLECSQYRICQHYSERLIEGWTISKVWDVLLVLIVVRSAAWTRGCQIMWHLPFCLVTVDFARWKCSAQNWVVVQLLWTRTECLTVICTYLYGALSTNDVIQRLHYWIYDHKIEMTLLFVCLFLSVIQCDVYYMTNQCMQVKSELRLSFLKRVQDQCIYIVG